MDVGLGQRVFSANGQEGMCVWGHRGEGVGAWGKCIMDLT